MENVALETSMHCGQYSKIQIAKTQIKSKSLLKLKTFCDIFIK